MKEDVIVAGLVMLVIAGLLAASAGLSSWKCGARWGDFETRWGFLSGCQVQQNGKWFPEDRVRGWEE